MSDDGYSWGNVNSTQGVGAFSTDLFSVVKVFSVDKYRSHAEINQDCDKVRVVLDFNIKNNFKLYRMFLGNLQK